VGREAIEQASDAAPCCFDGSLGGFPKQDFELGEDLLDGIEIGTIGREEDKPRADSADRSSHGVAFVAAISVGDSSQGSATAILPLPQFTLRVARKG
jgi:hypothetical protein